MTYEVRCGDVMEDCPFRVWSDDDKEIMGIVMRHARTRHGVEVSAFDARRLMRRIDGRGPVRRPGQRG